MLLLFRLTCFGAGARIDYGVVDLRIELHAIIVNLVFTHSNTIKRINLYLSEIMLLYMKETLIISH